VQVISLLSFKGCFAQKESDFRRIIKENKPEWISSWENNPLINFEKPKEWKTFEKTNWYNGYWTHPLYAPVYIYSPSKTLFVDIYSRTVSVEIVNGDTIMQYLEPESEIVLFDTIKKSAYSLAFFGSTTYFDDLIWITDSCFIVLGTCYEQGEHPLIMIYDIENMIYTEYKGTMNKRMYSYIEKKFNTGAVKLN